MNRPKHKYKKGDLVICRSDSDKEIMKIWLLDWSNWTPNPVYHCKSLDGNLRGIFDEKSLILWKKPKLKKFLEEFKHEI